MRYQLHHGDNRAVLKTMPDNSVDSIVCDPPYELSFMGKRWDASGIAYDATLWAECLRVLKPGGHLIAFGGTRTYHRMAVAIEDAGFEIRDSIIWMYGSGFPKSLDVSKAIDKQAGAEREVVPATGNLHKNKNLNDDNWSKINDSGATMWSNTPATPEAQQWHGWGTALKPAHEPAVLARKPLTGTVADNVLTWGTGALNIDESRVGSEVMTSGIGKGYNNQQKLNQEQGYRPYANGLPYKKSQQTPSTITGRWPANVILDEHAAEALDAQSGVLKSGGGDKGGKNTTAFFGSGSNYSAHYNADIGGASRFFYIAKASRAEREAGLEGMEVQPAYKHNHIGRDMSNPKNHLGNATSAPLRANHHPTVKPIALMRHLVRLVTPKGGTVLDPFMGSGSTGCAAMLEGMRFVGIDITAEYVDIAERRILHWLNQNPMEL